MLLETLVSNISGKVRREFRSGREYIVAPLSLIVPGVLNGSQGPLLYPLEEISKDPDQWNGVPLTWDHPVQNGSLVSARDPDIYEQVGLGHVYRSRVKGKLGAEGWFDVEKTRQVDGRIIDNLLKGTPLELSTGLFTRNEPAPEGSVHNDGRPYKAIARNYKADHVAILMDKVGACSLKDGCGVLINQETGERTSFHEVILSGNVLSHEDLETQLRDLLRDRFGSGLPRVEEDIWVDSVFSRKLVYRNQNSLYQLGYSVSGDTVSLSEDAPVEVRRVTVFKPVSNSNPDSDTLPEDDNPMKLKPEERTAIVNELVSNCSCWDKADTEVLNGLSDERLQSLKDQHERDKKREALVNAAKTGFKAGNSEFTLNEETGEFEEKPLAVNTEASTSEEQTANSEAKQIKEEDLPQELRDDLAFARNMRQQQKKELIDRIVQNREGEERKQLSEVLGNKSLDELRTLSLLAPAPEKETQRPAHYVGANTPAGPTGNAGDSLEDEGFLIPPTVNYAEPYETAK